MLQKYSGLCIRDFRDITANQIYSASDPQEERHEARSACNTEGDIGVDRPERFKKTFRRSPAPTPRNCLFCHTLHHFGGYFYAFVRIFFNKRVKIFRLGTIKHH
jgi:hypothetical protein